MASYKRRRYLGAGYGLVLSIWQIAQPATKESVYFLLRKTPEGKMLSIEDFDHVFERLCKGSYIWKAGGETYIVTPLGASIASMAVPRKERDMRRFYYLNKQRHFEVGA